MDLLFICIRDGYYVIVTDNVYLRDYLVVKKTVNWQFVLSSYVENTLGRKYCVPRALYHWRFHRSFSVSGFNCYFEHGVGRVVFSLWIW